MNVKEVGRLVFRLKVKANRETTSKQAESGYLDRSLKNPPDIVCSRANCWTTPAATICKEAAG